MKVLLKDIVETDPKAFAKVNSIEDESGCWIWQHCLNKYKYAHMNYNGKIVRVIRIITNSPDDKVVRHICDNPKCVNPDHLIVGTQKENRRDTCKNGDCVHCPDQTRAGKVTWSVPTYAKFGCCMRCYKTKFKLVPLTEDEFDAYCRNMMNKSNAKKRLKKLEKV